MTPFADLGLAEPLIRPLKKRGYKTPTPVQMKVIPSALSGRDILAVAPTGTGKTAAYALPVLQQVARIEPETPLPVRALVLAPTRELATQIGRSFTSYGKLLDLRCVVLSGGTAEGPQLDALRAGADIVVATPGRLLDFLRRSALSLDKVGIWVLDESDRMLDLGFVADIRQIRKQLPRSRQTLLFSATLPDGVQSLSNKLLRDPVRVTVEAPTPKTETIDQWVCYVDRLNKPALLHHWLTTLEVRRALVFVRTRAGVDRLVTLLQREGLAAAGIHGDRTQAQRNAVLADFRLGKTPILVATDVAARGLDVPGITHVFNHELPYEAETYVHRIGRTGRAGADGLAITLCDATEGGLLRDVERLTGRPLTPRFDQPWHTHAAIPDPKASGKRSERRKKKGKNRGKKRRR